MAIALPDLPYACDALEPVISAATLKLHHGAHHRSYVDKLNGLIKGTEFEHAPLEEIVRRSGWSKHWDARSRAIFNNAAQAWNHAFYWRCLRPPQRGSGIAAHTAGPLAERVKAAFGGVQAFVDAFKAAATGLFGSGWVWLVDDAGIEIEVTPNADTPIAHGRRPLLVLDVWEHAYYLDYQAKRAAYVDATVELLDWRFAERNFAGQEALHA
ncbi:MAG: superoxide dismutase [Betaproteobacteria bacterium]